MNYSVKVTECLEDVDGLQWANLTTGRPFSSQRWFRIANAANGDKTLYFLLYSEGRLVGQAMANLSANLGVALSSTRIQHIVGSALRRFPLLICQTHLANLNGLILPPGDELNALNALSEAFSETAAAYSASFIVLGWLSETDRRLIEPLSHYEMVTMDAGTTLSIQWSSFDEYLQNLSKSMRKDINRHNNRARDLKITIERAYHFTQHTDRLVELITKVEHHHHSTNSIPSIARFLETIEREVPDGSVMLLARVDGVLVGCGLLLFDQGMMGLALLGMDYSYKYVYFQLFYEAIRFAIERNIKSIRGGTGAYEFKRRLGFEEATGYAAFSSHRRILRWLGHRLSKTMRNVQNTTTADATLS